MSADVKVIELGARMRVDPGARNMMAVLQAGPAIADAMLLLFPELPQNAQRVLATIIAFRLMGSTMPASPELFKHLPLTARMSEPELFATAQDLVDGDVLLTLEQGDEMNFAWAALESLIAQALADADAPRIVGADGEKLR